MKIENIETKIYDIDYKNSQFKEIIEKNKHLLPKIPKKSVSFDLIESNEAFANAIRRVFNDELLIKCFDVNVHNINTNDVFILPDNIRERLNLISINQSIDDKLIFNLKVNNNTNDIINVYADSIINTNKSDNKMYFNNNIQICTLKPNKYLNLSNIFINKGHGYDNNIYSIGSFNYKCINTDFSIASVNNTLKDFNLRFLTNSNTELKYLIELIYNNLYFRLKKTQSNINEYIIDNHTDNIHKINNDMYILANNSIKDLDNLDISNDINDTVNDLYEIHINNEYHTLGNLITKYVYNLDNNIELINYKLYHPLTHKIIITIKHPNYKKIISDAIDNIITDLNIFKNAFKNI